MRTGPPWTLELPEDVAGAQAAADAQDRGLGQRLARQARDDALVRQDVGERRRLRVQAAAHPVARRRGGVGVAPRASVRGALDEGTSGGGISLAGLGHARTHDPLEGLVGGHRSVSVTAVDARAHTATSSAGRMVDRFVPRIRIPFTAASPRRVGARSGGRARERAVASVRRRGTALRGSCELGDCRLVLSHSNCSNGLANDGQDRPEDDDRPDPLTRVEALAQQERSGGDTDDRDQVERHCRERRRDVTQGAEVEPVGTRRSRGPRTRWRWRARAASARSARPGRRRGRPRERARWPARARVPAVTGPPGSSPWHPGSIVA